MGEPSNSAIMQELEAQRAMLEKLLAAVPGAVDSEQSAMERREREAWVLKLAARSRMKASRK